MPTAPAQPQPPVTPRTAHASQRPCELYAHSGSPRPTRTQGHHRHPVYLQNRVYGQIRDPELLWVCGLCHDSIHAYLDWLLGDASKPDPMPAGGSSRRQRAPCCGTCASPVQHRDH
jgi:hypothetical protein